MTLQQKVKEMRKVSLHDAGWIFEIAGLRKAPFNPKLHGTVAALDVLEMLWTLLKRLISSCKVTINPSGRRDQKFLRVACPIAKRWHPVFTVDMTYHLFPKPNDKIILKHKQLKQIPIIPWSSISLLVCLRELGLFRKNQPTCRLLCKTYYPCT